MARRHAYSQKVKSTFSKAIYDFHESLCLNGCDLVMLCRKMKTKNKKKSTGQILDREHSSFYLWSSKVMHLCTFLAFQMCYSLYRTVCSNIKSSIKCIRLDVSFGIHKLFFFCFFCVALRESIVFCSGQLNWNSLLVVGQCDRSETMAYAHKNTH